MANINAVIEDVEKLNPELAREIRKYVKSHSYGLVYENNLPDAVRLYKKTVAVGDSVNILPERGQEETDANKAVWTVKSIDNGKATLVNGLESCEAALEDVVVIVGYKDVIYPGLKEIDRIERGNPDDPYHMVINSENYHALEALTYAYAGKVDCIYIDPPYNKKDTKDWKYNCDYVDGNDQYKHSKWLTFMERRLKLAKQLLNPKDSVLIVTIDEVEYARLGLLLEQIFPEARIQMVSSVNSPQGNQRKMQFSRIDEYIYFVEIGESAVVKLPLEDEWRINADDKRTTHLHWQQLIRNGADGTRRYSPKSFYPIYVSKDGKKFLGVGDPPPLDVSRDLVDIPDGVVAIWPMHEDGTEGRWACTTKKLLELHSKGYVKLGALQGNSMYITYLQKGMIEKVENGYFEIDGYAEDGSIISTNEYRSFIPGSQWRISSHDSSRHGSTFLKAILCENRFPFPKSLYAVHDALRFFVDKKPEALIIDFFSGSGTTLHAVNLMNEVDRGKRRCICVTNNEVSSEEEKEFRLKGLRPYDEEWDKYGIARYVTWPRTVCSIEGHDINGKPLDGDYGKPSKDVDLGYSLLKSEGFKANAIFCELTYESAWPIRLDNAFDAIAPILWMLAGCRGPIIRKLGKSYLTTDYYGVLFDYSQASKFCEKVKSTPTIKTAFVVTDDQRRYSNMCKRLPGVDVHRLYESFLRTFEICGEGGLD